MSFDEKKAIATWRGQLAETGTLFEADLDELESHLGDHIEALAEVGIHGEEAFTTAVKQLGETRTLATEFAKVNPLLAWRAALFWVCAGVMIVLAGRPLMEIAGHGVAAATIAFHLGSVTSAILMWLVVFSSPLVFFSLAFHVAKKTIDDPIPWARSSVFRVGLIVGTALVMLIAHVGVSWGIFDWLEGRWAKAAQIEWRQVWRHARYASYSLAVAGPLYLAVVAVRERSRALRSRVEAAPLFWLAIGFFIGAIRCELHLFTRSAAFVVGSAGHFGAAQMNALMWIVTLACPLVLFASTYAYLRHRAPGPSQLLRTRGILLALAISGAVGIGAVFATASVTDRSQEGLSIETIIAGYHGWVMAGIVTSALLPIIVGTILLRLRPAARLAAFR